MDTLNLDYDIEADLLYASFGPPRPAGAYHFDRTDNIAMVGEDGTMVGFDVFDLSKRENSVPLISGRAVRGGKLHITPTTAWLHLRLHADDLLELWLDRENKIVVRGLARTDGGDPLIVDLAPLMAHR